MPGFVLKTADFQNAIQQYKAATKKDLPYILNRALRNVGYKAAEFTPKKDPAKIEAELRKDKIGLKFITKRLTARKGKTYQTSKGTRTVRRVTRKQIALRTRQFMAGRKKRVGFLRAGWVAAMMSAGVAKGFKGEKLLKNGKSKIGTGRQATPDRLRAVLNNATFGRATGKAGGRTRVVMRNALERAMAFVANDMRTYAAERLAKTAARYSARRAG